MRLTDAQRALIEGLAARYPHPDWLLRKAHPGTWRKARAAGLDEDDIASACWDGAVRAAQLFDPGAGAAFATYAVMWMRSETNKAVRQAGPAARHLRPDRMSDDGGPLWDLFGAAPAPPEPAAEFWAAADRWLDPRARTVIRLRYVEDMTLAEAGGRMGLSKERVRQLEEHALWRLRSFAPDLAGVGGG